MTLTQAEEQLKLNKLITRPSWADGTSYSFLAYQPTGCFSFCSLPSLKDSLGLYPIEIQPQIWRFTAVLGKIKAEVFVPIDEELNADDYEITDKTLCNGAIDSLQAKSSCEKGWVK